MGEFASLHEEYLAFSTLLCELLRSRVPWVCHSSYLSSSSLAMFSPFKSFFYDLCSASLSTPSLRVYTLELLSFIFLCKFKTKDRMVPLDVDGRKRSNFPELFGRAGYRDSAFSRPAETPPQSTRSHSFHRLPDHLEDLLVGAMVSPTMHFSLSQALILTAVGSVEI